MNTTAKVLFTKKISKEQKEKCLLAIDDFNFIQIKSLAFSYPSTTFFEHLVFTSQNAVDAFFKQQSINKFQSIYAVGKKTCKRLMKHADFQNIKTPLASQNTHGLIERIQQEKADNFLYLCGKNRLPLLEDYWRKAQKNYQAIEVYKTDLSPALNLEVARYEYLCFCSPSAVESYFNKYTILPHHKLLCIGETTAERLENIGIKRIYIAPEASIESMLIFLEERYKK